MNQNRMGTPMSDRFRWPHALTPLAALLFAGMFLSAPAAHAAEALPASAAASAPDAPPVVNSEMDDQLFYEMLVGEMALNDDDAGSAYELILDAARRSHDEGLFRHAVDIALQRRAGDQALAAARAWQTANPNSLAPLRMQLQILLLLNRPESISAPLAALLQQTPAPERPALIAGLPLLMQRVSKPEAVAAAIEDSLKPYLDGTGTAVPSRVSIGRCWLAAHDPDRALSLARESHAMDATAAGPALLALELMHERPQSEALVLDYLKQAKADPTLRLAYVRLLTTAQRYTEAVPQLQTVTQQEPNLAAPFLTLGALQLELGHPAEGEAALLRYLTLAQTDLAAGAAQTPAAEMQAPSDGDSEKDTGKGSDSDGDDDDDNVKHADRGVVQAWLMLAQAAENRGDYPAAEAWLAKVDDPKLALEVQTRRASILVHQGKIDQAIQLIHQVPERGPDDARAKLLAEAGVLRDAKLWQRAFDVLGSANQRFADDTDLLYEQAMMADKIDRMDEMERLLRRVIELKPDNAQAQNALGYSMADRKQRLPEARALIQRALELSPGDPFITDSLGWVEYRLGHFDEAVRLLREAYGARPDPEIGAHLGEVLWTQGKRDEARVVWREAKVRDGANDVLRETLTRLRVGP
jgi:tetratricopeptide (TPR) repeat protein